MRLFIAIELPNHIINTLIRYQSGLLHKFPRVVKLTSAAQLHLTLKFLGEVDTARIQDLNLILDTVVQGIQEFSMTLSSGGVFPSEDSPRVCWIGINEGKEQICELAKRCDQSCEALDVPRETRDYQPHVTIARISGRTTPEISEFMKEISLKHEPLPVTQVVLFHSVPIGGKRRYDPIIVKRLD